MELNLPKYQFKIRRQENGQEEVYDPFRKKFLVKTSEELVRLHFIQFLILEKNYPESLIGIEKGLVVNKMKKRFDAVVFDNYGNPKVLIEFKAPDVQITQKVFDQVGNYNVQLKVKYLIVSNGLNHYCCKFDDQQNKWVFLTVIPDFQTLIKDV